MAIDETPGSFALHIDRGYPVGASEQTDSRLALHVNVKNSLSDPVPVFVTDTSPTINKVLIASFSQATSVASSTPTTLATYIVPATKTFLLQRIDVGGTNIALFDLNVDAALVSRRRTWFAEGLNEAFVFVGQPETGLKLIAGQTITVVVTHQRPDVGDFEATIQGVLIG